MNIASFLGEDDHTGADGAYTRLLKTRKWVILAATVAILVSSNLYDAEATKKLFPFFSLPIWKVAPAAMGGLAYALLIYVLLAVQLGTSYDITIRERLTFRRSEELSLAAAKLTEARNELHRLKVPVPYDDDDMHEPGLLARLRFRLEASVRERFARPPADGEPTMEEILASIRRIISEDEPTEEPEQPNDEEIESQRATEIVQAQRTYFQAQESYEIVQSENPYQRPFYKLAEASIDLVRLAPPVIFGVYAVWHLGAFILAL